MPTSPVVVITGASSGIGRATALAFARQRARVVLAARNPEALELVAAQCMRLGAQALVVPTDVADAKAVRALAAAALRRFGGIDVWVNNVGVGAIGRFEATPMEAHRRVIESNLLGHMHGAHAVLPHFRSQGAGVLINMISLGGWVPTPYAAAYVASKFGLRGWSATLRAELSDTPGVHVCDVAPAFVNTPGLRHGANFTGRRLSGPPGMSDPDHVAAVIVRLARKPRPTTWLGVPSLPGRLAQAAVPGLVGRIAKWVTDRALAKAERTPISQGNLFDASRYPAVHGSPKPPAPVSHMQLALGVALLGAVAIGAVLIVRARERD
ncbi:SDR family oxidoreductase [Pseudorhodoferax sp. Leaf267]|uniref:SDR family oxidoreductase n=1 Tax=Pseudorhodoferax sp. Leaf267 TaxID=1736316 RepID=UPI000AFFBDE7|nr:SDR family oxidoreductase [Pseudorhodoferax sp. Leaf267]